MGIRRIAGNIVPLVILGAGIYFFMQWQGEQAQDGGNDNFAKSACVDEVGVRYEVSNVRPYEVEATGTGYTVRITAKSASGSPVRIVCLTNSHGGVRSISIDER